MEKAKKKVIEDGYVFAKGKSRSKVEGLESPVKKRVKLSSEERAREIESLHETIKLLKSRLGFKNQQLQKEKCMSNYKQCDQISAEIIEIQKEKKAADRQLTALVKKEAKAQWYRYGKSKKPCSKATNVRDNQSKLPDLFKQDSMSSTSTSTDDTIILTDSDEQSIETYSTMQEGTQKLDPPQSPILFEEPRAMVNDCTQELNQDQPQSPVLFENSQAIGNNCTQELNEDHPHSPVLFEESHGVVDDCTQEMDQGQTQSPVLNKESRAKEEEKQNFC